MMNKERLEELHNFYVSGMITVDELIEEVVELEQINEVLINQNKRYREAVDKQFKEFWEACVKVVGEDTAYSIVAEMPEEESK